MAFPGVSTNIAPVGQAGYGAGSSLYPIGGGGSTGAATTGAAISGGSLPTAGVLQVAGMIGQEIIAGIARKKAAKRQAKAFQMTGNRLLQQAVTTEELSGFNELEFREQAGYKLSSIESLFADAGIGLTGSSLDVLLASKRRLEIDALKIRETGRLSAEESRFQASQAFKQAEYSRDAAKHAFFGLF